MKGKVINIAKRLNNHLNDRTHKNNALKVLKFIEEEKGKTNSTFIKQADEYSQDVLGWKGYAPWLYVYSAIAEEFKEGWIPDNYYGKIVVPKLKGEYGKVADNRALTKHIFNSDVFPDLYYYVNGLWFDTNYNVIDKEKVEKELTFEGGCTKQIHLYKEMELK